MYIHVLSRAIVYYIKETCFIRLMKIQRTKIWLLSVIIYIIILVIFIGFIFRNQKLWICIILHFSFNKRVIMLKQRMFTRSSCALILSRRLVFVHWVKSTCILLSEPVSFFCFCLSLCLNLSLPPFLPSSLLSLPLSLPPSVSLSVCLFLSLSSSEVMFKHFCGLQFFQWMVYLSNDIWKWMSHPLFVVLFQVYTSIFDIAGSYSWWRNWSCWTWASLKIFCLQKLSLRSWGSGRPGESNWCLSGGT